MQPASAQAAPGPGGPVKDEARCSRCGRENAVDAKFCAGCGIVLGKAPEAAANALDAPLSADVFKPLPQRDPRFAFRVAVASGVLTVAVAGAAYYLYRNFFFADFSPAYLRAVPATEERKGVATGPVGTSVTTTTTEAQAPAPVPERNTAAAALEPAPPSPGPARAASARAAPARAAPARSVPAEPRAPRKAVPARIAVKPASMRAEECTEALSAVGLCGSAAPQAASVAAGDAASKPAATPQRGTGSCQEGVSALGLCAPASNQ
jgi:hypothetical protein